MNTKLGRPSLWVGSTTFRDVGFELWYWTSHGGLPFEVRPRGEALRCTAFSATHRQEQSLWKCIVCEHKLTYDSENALFEKINSNKIKKKCAVWENKLKYDQEKMVQWIISNRIFHNLFCRIHLSFWSVFCSSRGHVKVLAQSGTTIIPITNKPPNTIWEPNEW